MHVQHDHVTLIKCHLHTHMRRSLLQRKYVGATSLVYGHVIAHVTKWSYIVVVDNKHYEIILILMKFNTFTVCLPQKSINHVR